MISLIDSVINPVKSCATCRHRFFFFFPLAKGYCFGLNGFHRLVYNTDGLFSGVILSDFHDVLFVKFLFHSVNKLFHRSPCVINFEGLCDPLI